uniref:PPIase cyclophilin-type domain-containing protein n=1 Tax=Panagrolaimus sp. JU765 TaxID=591449 RepID=A0AC34PVV3_9BILA
MGLILGLPEYFCRPTDENGDPILYKDLNPRVYMDLGTAAGDYLGRVIFRLSLQTHPKFVENFRQLCIGKNKFMGQKLCYKGSYLHEISTKNGIICGGDLQYKNGCGGCSNIPPNFVDNQIGLKPRRGSLCMLNQSHKSNRFDSQFFILTQDPEKLEDGVAFGFVEEGMEILDQIQHKFGNASGYPFEPIIILDCDQF